MKRTFKFILIGIILLSIFGVNFSQYTTRLTDEISSTDQLGQITSSIEYTQQIKPQVDNFEAIQILPLAFSDADQSKVQITLENSQHNIIKKWKIANVRFDSGQYYTLMLDKEEKNAKNEIYYLKITSNESASSPITFGCNKSGNYSGLYMNGSLQQNTSLSYKLQYKINGWNICTILLLGAIIVTVIVGIWLSKCNLKFEKKFLIIWIFLSIMYTGFNTPFNVPDEHNHFNRAYEISEMHFISSFNDAHDEVGHEMPFSNDELSLLQISWQSFNQNKGMQLSETRNFNNFFNTALYSPVTYIPQAIGIFIARHLTSYIVPIVYMGRVFNWLAITLILFFSLKYLPRGREFFTLLLLTPMNVSESVSLAPDGMVAALALALVTMIMYLCEHSEKMMSRKQFLLLYVLAILIASYKIVYLPLLLLLFLIPNKAFGSLKRKIIHAVIMGGSTVIISLVWLQLCNGFLIKRGTDSALQMAYIISHPFKYYLTIVKTIMNYGFEYATTLVGAKLGWLTIEIPMLFVFMYLVFIASKINFKFELEDRERVVTQLLVTFVTICVVLLIFTSLYLQWNNIYNSEIVGVQGRYFIPLLFPIYFAFNKIKEGENINNFSTSTLQWTLLINLVAVNMILFYCLK